MRAHPGPAIVLVAWLAVASPGAAEPIGHVPPLPPPTLEQQLLISAGTAYWIARGRFWSEPAAPRRLLHDGQSFFDVEFQVDERLFGPVTDARLPLRLKAYPAAEAEREVSWWSRLFAHAALHAHDDELRELEQQLASEGLTPADYEIRRKKVRQKILRSPAYRDGRHLLLGLDLWRGCGDPYREADVLVEKGAPVLLMTTADPALGTGPRTLFSLDLHPASQALPAPEALEPPRAEQRRMVALNSFVHGDAVFVGTVQPEGETRMPAPGASPRVRGFDQVRYRVEEVLRGDLGSLETVDVRHPITGAHVVLRRVPPELLAVGSRLVVIVSRKKDAWVAFEAPSFPRPATADELQHLRGELEKIRDVRRP